MASISKDKSGGGFRIQFMIGGERRAIRLGKCAKADARHVADHVQALATAKLYGTPLAQQTASWLTAIHPQLQEKLVRAGLIEAETPQATVTLGEFMADYIASRCDVKPATKEIWRQGEMGLVTFFGANKPLGKISPGDADQYKLHLIGKQLAPMTVRKRLQFAKMIFRAAVRRRLITESPFADVSIKASAPNRWHFISQEDTAKLLAACSNIHWRVIVTLARYGGLRCASEVLSLRWQDINWSENRIMVQSPKTEHHPGKEQRVIPLFPELLPVLLEAAELAPEGAVYVVDEKMRKAALGPSGWKNCNLSTTFKKIIARAGLTPWKRPFHNLRSSRQTELAERFPSHVVCDWLGNSEDIARKHYLQVTDQHFADAIGTPKKVAQNPAQSVPESGENETKPNRGVPLNAPLLPPISCRNSLLRKDLADGEGFEPPVGLRPLQFSRLPP